MAFNIEKTLIKSYILLTLLFGLEICSAVYIGCEPLDDTLTSHLFRA
jgi:hypothetical protein